MRVGPVGATDPGADVGTVVPAADVLGEAQGDVLDVVGVDQRQAVDADELAGLVEQHPVEARSRGHDGPVGVDDGQAVVGSREEELEVVGFVRFFPREDRAVVCHA